MARLALFYALWGIGACSSHSAGRSSLLDMLPADNEVGIWVQTGGVQQVTDQTGLYNQIDGGAPKYIDRGWVGCVYADYTDGTRIILMAIHDMGNAANAQDIYNFAQPVTSQAIPGLANAVVDMGLSTSYAVYACLDRFYIELNIDEKSDAALSAIELFATDIFDRNSKRREAAGAATSRRDLSKPVRLGERRSDENRGDRISMHAAPAGVMGEHVDHA